LGLLFGIIKDNKGGEFFIKMSGTDFNKGKSSSMKATYNIDNPNLPYQTNLELWQTSFGLSAGGWLNAISLYGRIG